MSVIIFDKFQINPEEILNFRELTFFHKDKITFLKVFLNGDVLFGKNHKLVLNEKDSFGDILVFDYEEDFKFKKNLLFRCLSFCQAIYTRHLIVDTKYKNANFSLKAEGENYYSVTEFKYE